MFSFIQSSSTRSPKLAFTPLLFPARGNPWKVSELLNSSWRTVFLPYPARTVSFSPSMISHTSFAFDRNVVVFLVVFSFLFEMMGFITLVSFSSSNRLSSSFELRMTGR